MKKGDYLWLAALLAVTTLLFLPEFHQVFLVLTKSHPYLMGFVKFSLLATMGELLALRIEKNTWVRPAVLPARIIIWGLIGITIVLMFELFMNGVNGVATKGLLWTGSGPVREFWLAFYISATMNLTFAPIFMVVHRILDTYLDVIAGREGSWPRFALTDLLSRINWQVFIIFIAKTVLFFWIPAHTITFLLPPEYRVVVAAYLSIVLGAILASGKREKVGSLGAKTNLDSK